MKARIFIGSSTEGLEVAQKIKMSLVDEFECSLWTDDIFTYNVSYIETLIKDASSFDFGVMVFTKDDQVKSRGKKQNAPRDNVLFEYGLFLGRLGIEKAFIVAEEGVKIPTDLEGLSLAKFIKDTDDSDRQSLASCICKIKKQIHEKQSLGFLGLLPSTVLAIGYFYNFVKLVVESMVSQKGSVLVDSRKFSNVRLIIIIPKDLDSDMRKRATTYYHAHEGKMVSFETGHRPYPLYAVCSDIANDEVELYDMPTTLEGANKAIDMYLRKGFIGKSEQQKLLEERELRNFEHVLRLLINEDAYCREYVSIIHEK